MKFKVPHTRGFSILETMIVVAITIVIASIGTYAFTTLRTHKQLEVAADALRARLEEARTYAMSGKGGTTYGVSFATSTYTLYSGSTYSAGAAGNVVTTLPSPVTLSRSLSGGASTILFARITGLPSATGTLTLNNSSSTASVTVGTMGDVNVVK
jgi:type II secretory pathway pseudopilin PulG